MLRGRIPIGCLFSVVLVVLVSGAAMAALL
jgi:hypothetical protein